MSQTKDQMVESTVKVRGVVGLGSYLYFSRIDILNDIQGHVDELVYSDARASSLSIRKDQSSLRVCHSLRVNPSWSAVGKIIFSRSCRPSINFPWHLNVNYPDDNRKEDEITCARNEKNQLGRGRIYSFR